MMKTYDWELSNSWECYTPDITFLNCKNCAAEFAKDHGLEIEEGARSYSNDQVNDTGISECWACGHEFDYPPNCDGCQTYLKGNLTNEGRQYLLERLGEWPRWLVEYHLGEDYALEQDRLIAAESSTHQVRDNGQLVGYHTHLGGLYICIKCGHLCECGQDEQE
jgi:hypothetical protein